MKDGWIRSKRGGYERPSPGHPGAVEWMADELFRELYSDSGPPSGRRQSSPAPSGFHYRSADTPSHVAPLKQPTPSSPRSKAPDAAPPEHVELRESRTPEIKINLRSSVREALFAYARESGDGLETAGALFGDRWVLGRKELTVRWATHAAQKRSSRGVCLDVEAIVREKAALRRNGFDDVSEVGCWHTHPDSRDGRPSDADLTMLLNARDFLDRPFYVGLILTAVPQFDRDGTPRPDLWLRSDVHAWVLRREGLIERAVCEPAAVKFS